MSPLPYRPPVQRNFPLFRAHDENHVILFLFNKPPVPTSARVCYIVWHNHLFSAIPAPVRKRVADITFPGEDYRPTSKRNRKLTIPEHDTRALPILDSAMRTRIDCRVIDFFGLVLSDQPQVDRLVGASLRRLGPSTCAYKHSSRSFHVGHQSNELVNILDVQFSPAPLRVNNDPPLRSRLPPGVDQDVNLTSHTALRPEMPDAGEIASERPTSVGPTGG